MDWKSPEDWPTFTIPYNSTEHIEERPALCFVTFASTDSHPLQTLLERCSTYTKLLRVLGICLRAISRFRKIPQSSLAKPLAPRDLEATRNLLVKFVQGQYYEKELRLLAGGCLLQKSHNLVNLTPYIDCHGILKVGGRLKNSLLDRQQKHPVALPKHSLLTSILIDYSHKRTFHDGTQQTFADLRRSVWIIGGRVPVRSHILRCVIYARHRGT